MRLGGYNMNRKNRITELRDEVRRRMPKSGELWNRGKEIYPGGKVSAARVFDPWPFYATRGQGPYIWDVDGNRYIDCAMCFGVLGWTTPNWWINATVSNDSGGWFNPGNGNIVVTEDEWHSLELMIIYSDSGEGGCEFWVDGALMDSVTGWIMTKQICYWYYKVELS